MMMRIFDDHLERRAVFEAQHGLARLESFHFREEHFLFPRQPIERLPQPELRAPNGLQLPLLQRVTR